MEGTVEIAEMETGPDVKRLWFQGHGSCRVNVQHTNYGQTQNNMVTIGVYQRESGRLGMNSKMQMEHR